MAIYLVSGSIIQTCFIDAGMSSAQIGLYSSVCSAVNIIVSILLAYTTDKIGKMIQWLVFFTTGIGVSALMFIPVYSYGFAFAVAVGVVQNIFIALQNLLAYRLPYHIFEMRNYNSIMARDGIITGIVSVVEGIIFSRVLMRYDVRSTMCVAFVVAAVLFFFSALMNLSFSYNKVADTYGTAQQTEKKTHTSVLDVIKMPCFYRLVIPNFLRGIMTGAASLVTTIGISKFQLTAAESAVIPIICTAANISGSFAYDFISRKVRIDKVIVISSAITMSFPICALFMGVGSLSKYVFLVICFAVSFGIIMINYSVPYMVYGMIPYETAGEYNTFRLVISTAGTMTSTALIGVLLDKVPLIIILSVAAVAQILSGLAYRKEYNRGK